MTNVNQTILPTITHHGVDYRLTQYTDAKFPLTQWLTVIRGKEQLFTEAFSKSDDAISIRMAIIAKINKHIGVEARAEQEKVKRDLEVESHAERMQEMQRTLQQHGIKMAVSSCGCCKGVSLTFEHNGQRVVNDEGYSNFDMFAET